MAKKTLKEHEIKFLLTAKNKTEKAFGAIKKSLPSIKTLAVAVSASLILIGTTIGTIGTKSVQEFTRFESALVSMARVTERSLGEIKKEVFDLDPALGGATELVKGYYNVISAGVDKPKEAINLLTQAAMAAQSSHVDLETTVRGMTDLMDGYGGALGGAEVAANKLLTIEKAAKVQFADLVPVIGQVAAGANLLNVDVDELGGLFAVVTKTAGGTEKAATQVKAIFNALLTPSAAMTTALDKMDVSTAKAGISAFGLEHFLKRLNWQVDDGSTSVQELFKNNRALIGIGPAMKDNFSTLATKINMMKDSADANNKSFENWKGTLEGMWETFKNSIGRIAISIGEKLAPQIKKALTAIGEFLEENEEEIVRWAGEFIDGVEKIIKALPDLYKKAKEVFNGIKEVFKTVWNVMGPIFTKIIQGLKDFVGGLLNIKISADNTATAVEKAWDRMFAKGEEGKKEPLKVGVDPENARTLKGFGQLIKTIGVVIGEATFDIIDYLFELNDSLEKSKTKFWDWVKEVLRLTTDFVSDMILKFNELTGLDWGLSFAEDLKQATSGITEVKTSVLDLAETIAATQPEIVIKTETASTAVKDFVATVNTIPSSKSVGVIADTRVATTRVDTIVNKLNNVPDINRTISIDVQGALDAIQQVIDRIREIPNVIEKKMVIEVETEASPRKPFGKGMDDIEERIGSLSSRQSLIIEPEVSNAGRGIGSNIFLDGTGTTDASRATPASSGASSSREKTVNQTVDISVNITAAEISSSNVNSLAAEIGQKLARDMNTGRATELKKSIERLQS